MNLKDEFYKKLDCTKIDFHRNERLEQMRTDLISFYENIDAFNYEEIQERIKDIILWKTR